MKTIKSRYVTINYSSDELLSEFNDRLRLTKKLALVRPHQDTIEETTLAKIDTITEKAEIVLEMAPDNMFYTIVLLADAESVADMFFQMYGRRKRYKSYYSISRKTIYISARDTSLRVVAHEIGHAIVDRYFNVRPHSKIHELLAQYAEAHIDD